MCQVQNATTVGSQDKQPRRARQGAFVCKIGLTARTLRMALIPGEGIGKIGA
jgi:hypothetical protein